MVEVGTKLSIAAINDGKQYEIRPEGAGEIEATVVAMHLIGKKMHCVVRGSQLCRVPQTVVSGEAFEREKGPVGKDGKPLLDSAGNPKLGRPKRGAKIGYNYEPWLDDNGVQVVKEYERDVTLTKPIETIEAIVGSPSSSTAKKSANKESTQVPAAP